jgi:type IV secretion system protein VirD4
VYLPGITAIDELREIEALSGKCTYTDKHNHEKTKSLVTVEEIRQLPENRALILSQNHPIILSKTAPYFRSLVYRHYAKAVLKPVETRIPNTPA